MKTKVLSLLWVLCWIHLNPSNSWAQWQWLKSSQSGINNQNFSTCVKSDGNGNAWFLGQAFSFAKVETDSVFFGNNFGSYIAKYNSAGVYQFMITAPKLSSTFQRFAITGGRLYFAVAFKDTVHKPNAQFEVYPGATGLAVYSYNPNNGSYLGVFVTALTKHNNTLPSLTQMEADPAGNLILFGNGTINNSSADTMYFGSKYKFGSNKGVGAQFSFLAKVSLPSGDAQWLKTTSGIEIGNKINAIYRNSLAVDADGNVVLGFNQQFNVNIDPDTSITRQVAALYKKNVFIVKFLSNGSLSFIKQFGSNLNSGSGTTDQDYIYGLATDNAKNIVIIGRYGMPLIFDAQTIQPTVSGKSNFYLAKLNASGNYLWSKQIDSTGEGSSGNSVKCVGSDILVGGTHDKQIKIGTTTLTRMGNNDAFIARYAGDGAFISAAGMHGGDKEYVYDLDGDANGNIFVSGLYHLSAFPNQGVSLLPGNLILPQGAVNGTLFWAKFGQGAPPANPPKAPANLVATATSTSAVALNWVDSSTNETAFVIQHSNNGTNWLSIDSVSANTSNYVHNGLNQSTVYYYRVYAKNIDGNSNFSNVDTALTHTPITNPTAPLAPSGLTATALQKKADGKIQLSWTDNSNNETSFDIERSLDGTNFSSLSNLTANTTSFVDSGLAFSTTYYYRVKASNSAGSSAYSNIANTNTLPNALLEESVLSFSCYPNPATSEITLSMPNQTRLNREINLYSMEGKLLLQMASNKEEIRIDLREFNKGIYLIEIEGTTKRIILN